MTKLIEVSACPLCGCSEGKAEFRKDIYTGLRCPVCSLVYLTPVAEDTGGFYTDDSTSSPSRYYSLSEKYDRLTFKERLGMIEEFAAPGRFLDIGCSVGTFLGAAEENGWEAEGIEPNPKAAEISKQKGYKVIQDFLNEEISAKYKGCFNAVYMGDVIEHVRNPVLMTELAVNMLATGGVLMAVTPDYDSPVARMFQVKPLEHILYFNTRSIKYLAEKVNLEIKALKRITRRRSLKALAYSTTFSGRPVQKLLIKAFSFAFLNGIINLILKLFVKDEVMLIVRKK